MKHIFAQECRQIYRELEIVMAAAIPINLCQLNTRPLKASLEEIVEHQVEPLLVFKKKEKGLKLTDKPYFALFKKPRKPIRGFEGTILTETDKAFTMAFPEELFEIQRRKDDRVPVHEGMAVFSRKDNSRLIKCGVLDVSMQGAKLTGSFPDGIQKGTLLEPLSLTLRLRFAAGEEMFINIPTATVKHVSQLPTGKQHVGVNFNHLSKEMSAVLEDYLSRRQLETTETFLS